MSPILPSLPTDDLAALFAAPRIHTDAEGVHTDDAGRRYDAALVGGEVAFTPAEPLTPWRPPVAAERSMIPLRCPRCTYVLPLVEVPTEGLYALAGFAVGAADGHAARCSGLSAGGRR